MSGDSVVISSVAFPDPRNLPLVADMQYHEPYTSAGLNRKLRGILREGFYEGFLPRPGGGLNLLITSVDGEHKTGSASVNIGDDYQITIRQQKDVTLALSAGTKFAIILKAVYTLGSDTYQVNIKSPTQAAEIYAKNFTENFVLGDGELLICTVNVPSGATEITLGMIDSTDKKIATIGIELSNDFNSNEEKKAATPKAVKDGIENHEKKADPHSQYAMKESPTLSGVPKAPTAAAGNNTTQIANTAFVQAAILALISGAPTTLDTLKELAAAINNDPNFSTTISNALALKAPLLSPGLTGTPTAPTAPQATNNTQIATTAFVRSAISALVGSSPEALDTLNELAAALGNDPNFATTMTNALAGKQPLNEILTAYSALNTAANKLAFFDGSNSVSLANLTAVGRVLIGQESISKVLEY
ncbi:phage tail protein, partial [Salmonella enterica]|nr:phage tail protein [Salmonella enterica]